jgi:hypothetical protein
MIGPFKIQVPYTPTRTSRILGLASLHVALLYITLTCLCLLHLTFPHFTLSFFYIPYHTVYPEFNCGPVLLSYPVIFSSLLVCISFRSAHFTTLIPIMYYLCILYTYIPSLPALRVKYLSFTVRFQCLNSLSSSNYSESVTQGLFLQRQAEVSKEFSTFMTAELLTPSKIWKELSSG